MVYYYVYVGYGIEVLIIFLKMVFDWVLDYMLKVYFGFGGLDVNEINIKLIWYYNNILGCLEKKKIIF